MKNEKAIRERLVTGLFFASALMVTLISAVVNSQINHYVETITESTQNHLMASAQAAAKLISAEELDHYHTAADADTREYREIKEKLIQFAQDYRVLYAYYWRRYSEDVLQYIVDNDTDPETQCSPDSFYPIEEIALNALAGNIISTDLGSYTPTWDGLISGFAPVYDSGGNFYCVAGVDISDEFIFIQHRNSRVMTLLQITALSVSVIFGVLNMMLYRRQAKSAGEADAAKTRFLSQVSHEIRTPLNAVIGFSEIELRNKLPASTRDNIMQIHQSGAYLLGIINDILDISKIESGKIGIAEAEYETAPLICRAVNQNRVRIGSKSIAFALEISGDFPRKLRGDELRIEQILNNLLSNAVKYTREGTITLRVEYENDLLNFTTNKHEPRTFGTARTTENCQGTGSCGSWLVNSGKVLIRFSIRDTGIGIRQEDMGKLFTSYVQLNAEANRKIEGTGLGLTIAQRLSQMMGGRITVESEYGRGSVFTAELVQGIAVYEPIGEDAAREMRNFRYAAEEKEADIAYTWMPDRKALVVDDKPTNLLVARGLLKPYGLRVDTAASGPEAIAMIKNEDYSLVFMDHMMGEMDGVEAVAIIREWERNKNGGWRVPIVALTASALRGMKEFYLEHGFDDYLSKPINSKDLNEALKKWLVPWDKKQQYPPPPPIDPFSLEIEALRLDKLEHFRAAFESGREIDEDYYRQFTALLESFGDFPHSPPDDDHSSFLIPNSSLLMEAAQRGDAQKIRETLPAFCEALKKRREAGKKQQTDLGAILPELKKAILEGENETIGKIMTEMGSAALGPGGRELYFKLYDLQFAGEFERAVEAIDEYSSAAEEKR